VQKQQKHEAKLNGAHRRAQPRGELEWTVDTVQLDADPGGMATLDTGNFVTGNARKAIRTIHVLVRLVPSKFRWSNARGVNAEEHVAGKRRLRIDH